MNLIKDIMLGPPKSSISKRNVLLTANTVYKVHRHCKNLAEKK